MTKAKTGFFNMDTIIAVCAEKNLEAARKIAIDRIEATKAGATPENIRKALVMVERAKSVTHLGLSITNFMFAHPSENLKTIGSNR